MENFFHLNNHIIKTDKERHRAVAEIRRRVRFNEGDHQAISKAIKHKEATQFSHQEAGVNFTVLISPRKKFNDVVVSITQY